MDRNEISLLALCRVNTPDWFGARDNLYRQALKALAKLPDVALAAERIQLSRDD